MVANESYTCLKLHGPFGRYAKLRFVHAPGMPGALYPRLRVSDPDMHYGTCVTHVPWCMPGSLTSGFLWSQWREKRSQHSRRMHNPQSGTRRHMKGVTFELFGKHCSFRALSGYYDGIWFVVGIVSYLVSLSNVWYTCKVVLYFANMCFFLLPWLLLLLYACSQNFIPIAYCVSWHK